jgi:hypothetical protein
MLTWLSAVFGGTTSRSLELFLLDNSSSERASIEKPPGAHFD